MNILDFNMFPQFDPIFGFGLTINFFVMIFAILYLIIRRIRTMGYVRTFVIWKDGTQNIKRFEVKDDKLQIKPKKMFRRTKDQWTPTVRPKNIIPARKGFRDIIRPFGFKQQDILIAVEDSPECVTIRGASIEGVAGVDDKLASVLMKTWTKAEINTFIHKALTQATVSRKLFNDIQFYVFLFVMVLNLIFTLRMSMRMGL